MLELTEKLGASIHTQDTEWMINPTLLRNALDTLDFKAEIELFASRLNRQFPIYCSFRPDPEASCTDAFTISWTEKKFYSFPPFCCVLRVLQKIIKDRATGVWVVPMWPSQSWYPILTTVLLPPVTLPLSKNLSESSRIPGVQPSSAEENEPSYLSTVRQQLQGLGFTTISIEVITSSWREVTTSQYRQKWLAFCRQQRCDILSLPIPMAVDFLSMLYERGSSYRTINTARSMLSSILQLNSNLSIPFGQLPVVKRFMKGIFERRLTLPRYKSIWDVSLVFTHFRGQPLASQLSLKDLTVKLTLFLSLLSGQRSQTIKSLTTDNMELSTDKCVFTVTDKMKQTRVGTHVAPLVFLSYPSNEKLCILTHLKE